MQGKTDRVAFCLAVLIATLALGASSKLLTRKEKCFCQDEEFCAGKQGHLEFYHCRSVVQQCNITPGDDKVDCECLEANCTASYNLNSNGLNGSCVDSLSQYCVDLCADMDDGQYICGNRNTAQQSHNTHSPHTQILTYFLSQYIYYL